MAFLLFENILFLEPNFKFERFWRHIAKDLSKSKIAEKSQISNFTWSGQIIRQNVFASAFHKSL